MKSSPSKVDVINDSGLSPLLGNDHESKKFKIKLKNVKIPMKKRGKSIGGLNIAN